MTASIYKIDEKRKRQRVSDAARGKPESKRSITHKQLNSLEYVLSKQTGVILQKINESTEQNQKLYITKTRLIFLYIFTLLTGALFSLTIFSVVGLISPNWMFWAAILFASAGVTAGLLLILLGEDNERYK